MAVALVIGADDITGITLIKHMLKDPKWTKIYAIANRKRPHIFLPKDNLLQYIACDVFDEHLCKKSMKRLQDVTHIFYVLWIKDDEQAQKNEKMFRNVLTYSDNFPHLKHFVLQSSLMYNGVHVGANRIPCLEDDDPKSSPDYIFNQEEMLYEKAKNANWNWNVVRAHDIVGFAGAPTQMNLIQSIAVYASMCKETGEKFVFPGTQRAMESRFDFTDVHVLAEFMLWLADHYKDEKVKNRPFNCVNKAEQFQWKELWYTIADYFKLDAIGSPEPRKMDLLMKERKEEWAAIAKKYSLVNNDLEQVGAWWHLDAQLGREWDAYASMERAREAGWKKEKDYKESLFSCFDKMQRLKIIPPVILTFY